MMIASMVGYAACTRRPAAVIPEPTIETQERLLDCAASTAVGLGFEIASQTGAAFSASRRVLGPGGSEFQDALVWNVVTGSYHRPKLLVRARSYELHRDRGAPAYLTELRTPSSDAMRAANDVERACIE